MNSITQTEQNKSTTAILQYNLNKNQTTTNSLLNHPSTARFAILALQEQYWSKYMKSSLTHHSWTLIEPTEKGETQPRTAIYINNNILPTTSYEPIQLSSSDATAIAIKSKHKKKPTLLINIYNTRENDQIDRLKTSLQKLVQERKYGTILVVGDFNLHHPLWNPEKYHHQDKKAEELIELMAQLELKLISPAGMITFPGSKTAIDLVWGNHQAEQGIIKCKIAKYNDHGSDHLPIETILNLQPATPKSSIPSPYNYDKTDWKLLNAKIKAHLPNLENFKLDKPTAKNVDKLAKETTQAIAKAIEETTPRKKPSPFSKRWWNDELTEQRKIANKSRNIYRRTGRNEDKEKWKKERNEYHNSIKQAKVKTWRDFVSTADETTIWQVKKYMDTIPTTTYIPTLQGGAATNDQKTESFQKAFFPPPPNANTEDINEATIHQYWQVTCDFQITEQQLQRAIDKLAPNKAPGPDEVPNKVLKKSYKEIRHHLLALAQASLDTGHFPTCFKRTSTAILRKPNKPDYTKPNAYRPIALENTIGKVLESVIAEMISYLTEKFHLIPEHHFGGRPGRTTEDAMMILTENIHAAWKKKEIYSVIFMDVAGAFNNVHHNRLIHNLRKRHIPKQITQWIYSFLQERTTQLRFNGTMSQSISTPAGVPQGSPLSPILYIYYNADLLEIPKQEELELGLGFIDDITYGVKGSSAEENTRRLTRMLKKAEEWRERHGAQFEKSKYMLVHFTRNAKQETVTPIVLNETTITPTTEAKYLGVTFDKDLKYRTHLDQIVKKGTKFALAIASIARSNWGPEFKYLKRLFTAVAAPRMDYAAIIWHRPKDYHTAQTQKQIRKMETIQRQIMKTITGCFKTTSTAALERETDLLPPHLRLNRQILKVTTRMQTLATPHPVKRWIKEAQKIKRNNTHISNLENLAKHFPQYITNDLEEITPTVRPPWWKLEAKIHIDSSKKEAARNHDRMAAQLDQNALSVYTDGSGIDGQVGAAAYSPTLQQTKHQYMGKETTHNVFVAELEGIAMALEMIKESENKYSKCEINVDSQAAIKAIIKPKQQSGQQTIKRILNNFDQIKVKQPSMEVTIKWIPGHKDIKGNEMADVEAKRAARQQGKLGSEPKPKQATMKATRNMEIKKAIQQQWEKEWKEEGETAKQLRRMSKRPHTEQGSKLYLNISNRQHLAWVARLRTGHCSLNKYLHRFNIIDDPNCECEQGHETVEHYLLKCGLYEEERDGLRKEVGIEGMRVSKLLGDPKLIKHTIQFIEKTERFEF